MSVNLLENFGGLDPAFNLCTAIAAGNVAAGTFGDFVGAYYTISNGTTLSGKVDGVYIEKVNGKTWIQRPNTGNSFGGFQLTPALMPVGNSRMYIGYRMRIKNFAAASTLYTLRLYNSGAVLSVQMAAGQQEVYIEQFIDREAGTIETFADGKAVNNRTTLGAADLTAFRAGTNTLHFPFGQAQYISMTDLYIVADTSDDSPCTRLGPQDISEVPLEVSSNTGWDVSKLTEVFALLDGQAETGNRVIGGGDNNELKFKPKTGFVLPSSGAVSAFQMMMRATYDAGNGSDVSATFKRGSRSDTQVMPLAVAAALPWQHLLSSSRGTQESLAASVLANFELSLKAVGR